MTVLQCLFVMDSTDFQVIIRYWLSLSFIDMNDDNQWTRLESVLRDGRVRKFFLNDPRFTKISKVYLILLNFVF